MKNPEKIGKTITCKACMLSDKLGMDLDSNLHLGFTVGGGKKMYWYFTWLQSGNASIFSLNDYGELNKRWISGDQTITIHFK